jgi:hypothetical protein
MRTALSLCLMALAGLGPVATANPVALSGNSGSIEMRKCPISFVQPLTPLTMVFDVEGRAAHHQELV